MREKKLQIRNSLNAVIVSEVAQGVTRLLLQEVARIKCFMRLRANVSRHLRNIISFA